MSGHSKWANIKRTKGKNDAMRAKVTTKISKEITIAARMGGGNPVGNMRLKLALTKARQNNVPKDIIKRAIDKGVGASTGAGFDEVTYEGYGPGGAAIIAECNTDNRNRMAADIRHAFNHNGGSLGATGSVGWMFKRKGTIIIDKEKAEEDTFQVITSPEDFLTVSEAIENENIPVEASEVAMIPDTTVNLEGDQAETMSRLIAELEEMDDVQEVYHNAELPEE